MAAEDREAEIGERNAAGRGEGLRTVFFFRFIALAKASARAFASGRSILVAAMICGFLARSAE